MNEVEKMYENAGIVPDCEHGECGLDYCPNNYGCGYAFYPPFTAEKQLVLIKWIAVNKEECRITYEKEYKWCTQTDWQSSFCYENFEESLANLINTLWQDLTEEECKQIRNILE